MKAKVNGIELNYEVSGNPDKPWLTFSNSLATNMHMWDEQAKLLADDYHILRYDKRGHGESEKVPGPYHFDDLIDDMVALWDHLGIDQTYYVGLSIGGMTVQGIMLKHPERLKAVVIANSMGVVPPEFVNAWGDRIKLCQQKGMAPLIQPTMERWFTEEYRKKETPEAQFISDMIASTSVEGYAGCAAAIQKLNYLDDLGTISGIPVLFIAGSQDGGTPAPGVEAMHRNMPGSEYLLLDPAAHISNVECPEAFNEAITGFLGKH